MILYHRIVGGLVRTLRTHATVPCPTALHLPRRAYHGDPGPSSSKLRKRDLRQSVIVPNQSKSTLVESFEQMEQVLNVPPKPLRSTSPRSALKPRSDRLQRTPRSQNEWQRSNRSTSKSGKLARREYDINPRNEYSGLHEEPISPYMMSLRIRKWIDKHPSPLSPSQVHEVEQKVITAPRPSVNAAVWNLILALLGREKKYTRMWKMFNDMKKRGVEPTSRTYTTLLNVYAGVSHSSLPSGLFTPLQRPENLTLDRVRIIYERSQSHIRSVMAKSDPLDHEDVGIAYPSRGVNKRIPEIPAGSNEINIMPTNAYLKFLGRFGLWEEMQRVFLAMDPSGPLSPDQITYVTLLHAANNIDRFSRSKAYNGVDVELPQIDLGPTARSIWDQAVRHLGINNKRADRELGRVIDEELVLTALQCLSQGRPEDQRLVETLIPHIWSLSTPGQPVAASSSPARPSSDLASSLSNIPHFPLTVRSATALMSLLGRGRKPSFAAHFTHLILDRPHLQDALDLPALRTAIHNLAAINDVAAVAAVLDAYQPPTGTDGWPIDVWHSALSAARWSADWPAALDFFRRMTHLNPEVERGDTHGEQVYVWQSPNGRPHDSRRKPWIKPRSYAPDVKAITLLLQASLAADVRGIKSIRQALNVYTYYNDYKWFTLKPHSITTQDGRQGPIIDLSLSRRPPSNLTNSARRAIDDRVELAKALQTAAEKMLEVVKSDLEREPMLRLIAEARNVLGNWSNWQQRG